MYLWQKLLIVGLGIGLLCVSIFAIAQVRTIRERDQTILGLQDDLRAVVQVTPEATTAIFRVSQPVRSGTIFDPSLAEVVQIPSSLMGPAFVTNPETLRGSIWRLNLNTHGLITYDMLAFEPVYPTDRFHIVMTDAVTPSLEVGDFVDIRMITPDGIDFVVLPKKRVVNIYSSGLEMVLSETEWMIYIGALIDKFMHPGTVLYASKYVDPALQNRLFATYIPPPEIVQFMNVNMNMLFPYVEGTDVEGMRSFIESTQPRHRYIQTQFTSQVQAIRDRESRISSALASQIGSMNRARSEYTEFMRNLYAQQGLQWTGGSVQQTQVPVTGVQGGMGQATTGGNVAQVHADGSWTDAGGTLRNPDGTPRIQTSDIINWGITPPEEAEIDYSGINLQIPNIGN